MLMPRLSTETGERESHLREAQSRGGAGKDAVQGICLAPYRDVLPLDPRKHALEAEKLGVAGLDSVRNPTTPFAVPEMAVGNATNAQNEPWGGLSLFYAFIDISQLFEGVGRARALFQAHGMLDALTLAVRRARQQGVR